MSGKKNKPDAENNVQRPKFYCILARPFSASPKGIDSDSQGRFTHRDMKNLIVGSSCAGVAEVEENVMAASVCPWASMPEAASQKGVPSELDVADFACAARR